MSIVPAKPDDRADIERLLASVGLPTADLTAGLLENFLVMREGVMLIAVIGLELAGEVALLRSLAVHPSAGRAGVGRQMVAAAEAFAVSRGVISIYLLTTTAAEYFAALAYRHAAREHAPAAIRATPQFAGLCPASSAFMVKP